MNATLPSVGDPDIDWALQFPEKLAALNGFYPTDYFAYLGGVWSGLVRALPLQHQINHFEWSIGYFHALEYVSKTGLSGKIPAKFNASLLRSMIQPDTSIPGNDPSGQEPR